ncbi:MAG: YggS family pyridoxal phosphate-dependent enzyme [Candidatus Krumholzibacteriota bacterium]|nr:YggS family pyridoxal phosphate-dependent enzyme [Candidatus Krumholzibacteriota bacterium]
MSIADNYRAVRDRVAEAAVKAGRDPSSVTIVAVTKTHPASVVKEALEAGIIDVGENRVQEFLGKVDDISIPCRWHLIGHLQTNKVNKVIGRFELVHSVDSFKLAERIDQAGKQRGVSTDILVEVNTSEESTKFGLEADVTMELCEKISVLENIRLKGLMTVGPWVDDTDLLRRSFRSLRELAADISRANIENVEMRHLSMGMTDDFETAIAEGSTIVRLGRVIFGPRGGG